MSELAENLAKGLVHDLRAIRDGTVSPSFKIGAVDTAARFAFPRSRLRLKLPLMNLDLFGRDEHLGLLMESYRAVQKSGDSEVCIVAGHSGAGKTSLIRQ